MTHDTISALADADRSSAAVKAENILRQRLRISNPKDPREVAEGLRRLFPEQAAAMDREASGLPSGLAELYRKPSAASVVSASVAEFDRARDAIDNELRALGTDNQLKEVDAEIEGWGQAIRSLVAHGRNAAQMALDPRSRDRALAIRHQLCDYARLVRLAGASNPPANLAYRRLAQGLDKAAALILVAAGEAMVELGVAGGQIILAAPVSELQARRDAVISALRCLNGTEDADCDEFPRGVFGLRNLLRRLREGGNVELLAYLDENAMARTLDDMIDYAANGTGRGLRVLSAAASVPLAQLERVAAAASSVDRGSPTVSRLSNTLALFIDTFQQSSGHRMLAIARPAIIHGGLQGSGIQDLGTTRLQQIVEGRGYLAQQIDCLMVCDCERHRIASQILVDGLLSGIDRAVDLYTIGTDSKGDGEPERRAVAYALLCAVFMGFIIRAPNTPPAPGDAPEDLIGKVLRQANGFYETLQALAGELGRPWAIVANQGRIRRLARSELFAFWRAEDRWLNTAPRFASGCTLAERWVPGAPPVGSRHPITNYRDNLKTVLSYALQGTGSVPDGVPPLTHHVPRHGDETLEVIARKL